MPEGDFGHVAALPDDIRDVLMRLCQDVTTLYRTWDLYTGLFGDSESLTVVSQLPVPFIVIEQALRTDLTMNICRLRDPSISRGRENLSFPALGEFYANDTELQNRIADFIAACEPVKINRNRLVGHSDKLTRLSPDRAMIPEIRRADIDAIFEKATIIINHVSLKYGGQTFGFGFPGDGGARGLLYWLKRSLDSRIPPP